MTKDVVPSNNLYVYCGNNPVNFIDPNGRLSLGKHWWNKISFIASLIDYLIIFVPAFWGVGAAINGRMAAQKIASAAAKKALEEVENRSRKAIIEMYVKLQVETAKRGYIPLSTALKSLSGAFVEAIFQFIGNSPGQIFANILDRLDRKIDGYFLA